MVTGVPFDEAEADANAKADATVPPWSSDSGTSGWDSSSDGATNDGSAGDSGSDATAMETGTDAALPVNHLVINEVDYDQPVNDDAEFVEIYNPTPNTIDLSDYEIVLANGANDSIYETLALSGMLPSGGYFVATAGTVVVPGGVLTMAFSQAPPLVQNGNPDAVGLKQKSTGLLVDALSYGGKVSFGGMNFVEGTETSAKDSGSVPGSLVRFPNGADTDNATNDWKFSSTPTPGAPNL